MEQSEKIIIYQVFTRLFGNEEVRNAYNGSLQENGCGKMAGFTNQALNEIKKAWGNTYLVYRGYCPCFSDRLFSLQYTSQPSCCYKG